MAEAMATILGPQPMGNLVLQPDSNRHETLSDLLVDEESK
jgi:hypothetical protein